MTGLLQLQSLSNDVIMQLRYCLSSVHDTNMSASEVELQLSSHPTGGTCIPIRLPQTTVQDY